MSLVLTGLIILGGLYFYMLISLPDVKQLKDVSMQVPLRIYTNDGKLIGEFGEKKRTPVDLNQVPKTLIHAILDTEDQRFYEHRGVDFWSLVRATLAFIETGKKSQGASTVTMQVARNFFLNRKKTFTRKINEILLAFKIDKTFSKDEILELYLNKIYFGNRAYGVASAAKIYYGKSLNELSISEMATIAGLPQAPSRDNPIANPDAARERRNHVLIRMLENDHIKPTEYKAALNSPIETNYHESELEASAPYISEIVRHMMVSKYGDSAYELGLKIYTTVNSKIQAAANQTLRDGVLAYDQRHDYRGPEDRLITGNKIDWQKKLKNIATINDLQPAAVLKTNDHLILALLANGDTLKISSDNFIWTEPKLIRGNIIRVYKNQSGEWQLSQLPEIEGAIVALDPKNGSILALNGGFSFAASNFNRITQAQRQTGSAFKPFIYSAALEKGLTLASIINDAPIVMEDPSTNSLWRPQNDSQNFYGPIRLRTALSRSRNLATIRLLQNIGIPYTLNYLKDLDFSGSREAPPALSLALGSGSTTPLKITAAYTIFVNGGHKITPFIVSTIIEANKDDQVIFQAKPTTIPEMITQETETNLPSAPRVISAGTAYLITDVLKEVIPPIAARRNIPLKRKDLAGKTGTTNEQVDAWFIGYNQDLVATVWLGFDQPKSTFEHGAKAAFPIWLNFMQAALSEQPDQQIKRPEDIVTVRIDPKTGLLAHPEQDDAIFEIFTDETKPQMTTTRQPAIDNPLDQDQEKQFSAPLF